MSRAVAAGFDSPPSSRRAAAHCRIESARSSDWWRWAARDPRSPTSSRSATTPCAPTYAIDAEGGRALACPSGRQGAWRGARPVAVKSRNGGMAGLSVLATLRWVFATRSPEDRPTSSQCVRFSFEAASLQQAVEVADELRRVNPTGSGCARRSLAHGLPPLGDPGHDAPARSERYCRRWRKRCAGSHGGRPESDSRAGWSCPRLSSECRTQAASAPSSPGPWSPARR